MKHLFVPYNLSLKLKEIGFDKPCLKGWVDSELRNGPECDFVSQKEVHEIYGGVLAPTYSQAFKWFRDTYTMNSYVDGAGFKGYQYFINGGVVNKTFPSYEEAELDCLDNLIRIIDLSGVLNMLDNGLKK